MTNEELDNARAEEAWNIYNREHSGDVSAIAARLAREGWTPPVAVDPDIAEAEAIWFEGMSPFDLALTGIKRGRELERVEAKPGRVWVKHNGSRECPVALGALVVVKYVPSVSTTLKVGAAAYRDWQDITHYAVITPPAEDVA